MNYFLFIIRSAFEDFNRNKIRTFLTSLGILIGVTSVVLLLALGKGLRIFIQDQFERLGSNIVYVMPGKFSQGGGFGFRPGAFGGKRYDEIDFRNLKKIPEVKAVVGIFVKTLNVVNSGVTETTDVFATTPEIFSVRNLETNVGRIFNETDIRKGAKVAVLGSKLAEKLFDNLNQAMGKYVKIENQNFSIIGVLAPKGGAGGIVGRDFDAFAYIPYTASYQFNPDKKFVAFYVQTFSQDSFSLVIPKVKQIMSERYNEEDFSVVEQTEIINSVLSIFSVINYIFVAIGAISLLVGGIGIMNIMYVSVVERIREIGIRRAMGALKTDILYQFLAESILLSAIGGALGLLIAFAVVLVLRNFFPVYIDAMTVVIALGVSSGVGIIFGVFPAKKAADLSPIDAIRYE